MIGEAAPQAPQQNPAKGPMNQAFEAGDKPEVKYEAEPFTEKELDEKVGKPRTELKGPAKEPYKDIMAQAKNAIKDSPASNGKVSHGDKMTFNIDDVDYVYLRDETQKGDAKDRLFKKA